MTIALINAEGGGVKSLEFKHDMTTNKLTTKVNELTVSVDTITLKNTSGEVLGAIIKGGENGAKMNATP